MTTIGDTQTIVIYTDRTTVVGADSAGPQGPPGPQGPAGNATAAEDLLFTYDIDGRLTDIDGETKYIELSYNVGGLLTTVTDTVSGVVKTLSYNVDNQLISLVVS